MAGTAAKPTRTPPVTQPASRGNLLQVLGVSFGVAVLIGNTILVGILRTPGDVAARLPNPGLFLGVWILGGLFALLATLSIAEPGAMLAQSGGQYVIVRRGLGVYPGFVVGWNDRTIVFPDVAHSSDMWLGSQVLPGEMVATQWINDHTRKSDKFVADIGGAEAIMGMTTRISLVGGDWANAPDPVRNMETAGRIYGTDDAAEAHEMAVANGCDYVFLPNRRLNTGTFDNNANATKFSNTTYFQVVYTNDDVSIYRVLP